MPTRVVKTFLPMIVLGRPRCRRGIPDRMLSRLLVMLAPFHPIHLSQEVRPVVWFEITGNDLATLERFYGQLLGWKLNADNPMHYGMVDTGAEGGIPGGIYAPGDSVGQYVSFCADVSDLDKSLAQAEQLGGKVVQPPTPLDSGSRVAMIPRS